MNSWEGSKLSTGRYRSLNIPSEASGDRSNLQSRGIYSKDVAWTVELSIIILQSNEHFRVQKLCSPEQHPDPHMDKVGLPDVKHVLNFKNVNYPTDCVDWSVLQFAVCCLLNRQTRGNCISTTAAH